MFSTTSTRSNRSQMHSRQHHDNIHTNYQSFKQTCSTQRNNIYCISINCWPEHSLFSWHSNNSSKTKHKLTCKKANTLWSATHISLSQSENDILTSFLAKHRSVFATDIQELGEARTQPDHIDTGDACPIRQRFYRQSPHVNAEMNRQIEEMLSTGIIEESNSMWQSPVVMVKKKNGQLRFAVDYRKLNAVTTRFTFPLPRLEDVFDNIGTSQAKLF